MTSSQPQPGDDDDVVTIECLFSRENLEGFALGALPESDTLRIQHHLRRCAPCRRSLSSIRRVTSLLPFLVNQEDPSPAARTQLFARIAEQERVNDEEIRNELPVILHNPWASSNQAEQRESTSNPLSRSSSWQRWIPPYVIAPLAICLIVLSAWANSLQNEVDTLRGPETPASASTQIAQLLPYNMQMYEFKPACKQCEERQASGQLGGDPNGSVGVVVAWNLDPNEKHQVWCIDNQGVKLLVTDLNVEYTGNVFQTVTFPQALGGYQQIYVARHDGTEDPDAELLVAVNDQQGIDVPAVTPAGSSND